MIWLYIIAAYEEIIRIILHPLFGWSWNPCWAESINFLGCLLRGDFISLSWPVYTHYRSTMSRQQQKTSIISPQSHPLGIQAGVHLARNQSPARLHSKWTDLSPLWRLNEVSTAIETCNHGHYEAPALSSGGYVLYLLLTQRCPIETGLKLSLTSIWTSCSSPPPPYLSFMKFSHFCFIHVTTLKWSHVNTLWCVRPVKSLQIPTNPRGTWLHF